MLAGGPEALAALGTALRASQRAGTDQLHVRRERTRLLAAFDRSLISRKTRWKGRVLASVVAAAAALLVAVVWIRRSPPASPPVVPSVAAIHADPGTVWSRRTADRRDIVVLERGELRIQVTHAEGKPPLLVLLPDGELEDTGTIFSVTVEAGHTARVAVIEGSVTLRIRSQPVVEIRAGETWSPPFHVAPRFGELQRLAPSRREARNRHQAHDTRCLSRRRIRPRRLKASASVSASAVAPSDDRSEQFRAAVASFNRGENAGAAQKFARFLAEYPRDPRAEDAAYLRFLSLRRAGETSAARAAALEYLKRFPAGFRRSEVESLSR